MTNPIPKTEIGIDIDEDGSTLFEIEVEIDKLNKKNKKGKKTKGDNIRFMTKFTNGHVFIRKPLALCRGSQF
jgi:hypothetical protein